MARALLDCGTPRGKDKATGVSILPFPAPSHLPSNTCHAIATQVSSQRHRFTYHDDRLYSHSFSTLTTVSSWIDNTQITHSTTTAGHGPTTRLLQTRHYPPFTAQTCQQNPSQQLLLHRAGLRCDGIAREEATLELALSSVRYLTTAQDAGMIYAIRLPSLPTRDFALGRTALTFAAAVTSASRLSAGEPWRIDVLSRTTGGGRGDVVHRCRPPPLSSSLQELRLMLVMPVLTSNRLETWLHLSTRTNLGLQ